MPTEVINSQGAFVQPLVFETGIPETPYSIIGTVFFVKYMDRAFVLTARHVLIPENVTPICIFPSDTAQQILPLKDVFFVSEDDAPDDFADLAIIEIDKNRIIESEVGNALLIELTLTASDWLCKSKATDMFVWGYPSEYSFVDYERQTIINNPMVLHGRYVGESELSYLHILEISDTFSLSTFRGLSGSPVFSLIEHPGNRREMILCGMALRGTPTSRLIHFLDRSVLLDALNARLNHP